MSHPQFLADHDLNEHIIAGVRRREPGVAFLRLRDQGLSASADSDVLEYAANHGLIVVSHDVNTMPAAAFEQISNGRRMGGLLMIHQKDPIGAIIESLLLIWSASETEDWYDQVCFLPL